MRQGDTPSPELVRAVLEMRASVGTDVVRRCSERCPAEQREEIGRRANAVAALALAGEEEALVDGYVRLWEQIVDGSGNLAYRLALNSLNGALTAFPELAAALTPKDPTCFAGSARRSPRVRSMQRSRRRGACSRATSASSAERSVPPFPPDGPSAAARPYWYNQFSMWSNHLSEAA